MNVCLWDPGTVGCLAEQKLCNAHHRSKLRFFRCKPFQGRDRTRLHLLDSAE